LSGSRIQVLTLAVILKDISSVSKNPAMAKCTVFEELRSDLLEPITGAVIK